MRITTIIAALALSSVVVVASMCTEPLSSPSKADELTISAAQQQGGPKGGPKIKSVKIAPSSASVAVGASVQLTATTSPATATSFVWTTSNSSVATVSQTGLVTGAAPGTATVSASAGGKTGTSAITVTTTVPPGSVVFVGAGDIASCSSTGDEATATLLDGISGTVFTLGDNAYETGSVAEFSGCYDPSWGRHKARTRPAPGNHDYGTAGAAGYYGYFGSAAGDPSTGYYSYDIGEWHIIALNSNLANGTGSTQEQWLRADLAASTKSCTLAYWHHPRFSSGLEHGSDPTLQPLWQALYDANADVILSGHDHDYERFAPQTPAGVADAALGIREFVVGTGGRSHYSLGTVKANSEVFNGTTYGVLKLTLAPGSYTWQFVPVSGGIFTDSGTGTCH
ncbi:MAG: Ig-like domain-containing protein [Gemmatimonadales bacterium]